MDAIRASETSVDTNSTQRHIPEDGVLHTFKQIYFLWHVDLLTLQCLITSKKVP
jgi:hypothetical protein